jgi:TolB-like protein
MDVAGLSEAPRNPGLPDRPSIAVLPFVDLGPEGREAYLAEGIADELTIDLGRLRELFVISRSSAFTYRGSAVDVKRVGRELGVRYVVEGGLRAVDDQVVVTAQLVDASSGFQLWSGRYERPKGTVIELQREIAAHILNAIGVRIGEAEVERARRGPAVHASAYPAYVRAQASWFRFTRADNAEAEGLVRQALSIEPDDSRSHALLASIHLAAYVLGWDPSTERLQGGRAAARRAIELDPFSARGYASLAIADLWTDRREEALEAARRAVEVGPNSDLCYGVRAMAFAANGSVGEAIDALNRALRLNPRSPSLYWMLLGYMYETAGKGERDWRQRRLRRCDTTARHRGATLVTPATELRVRALVGQCRRDAAGRVFHLAPQPDCAFGGGGRRDATPLRQARCRNALARARPRHDCNLSPAGVKVFPGIRWLLGSYREADVVEDDSGAAAACHPFTYWAWMSRGGADAARAAGLLRVRREREFRATGGLTVQPPTLRSTWKEGSHGLNTIRSLVGTGWRHRHLNCWTFCPLAHGEPPVSFPLLLS